MRIKSTGIFLLALAVLTTALHAAIPTELVKGLGYVRVHSFAGDEAALTAALTGKDALVVDLRYSTASADSADAFYRTLAKRAGSAPLFILVSPATPGPLAETLAASSIKFVTLGVQGSLPSPKVMVAQSADTDRRAYDALESGLPVADLVSGKIEKSRYDEASLMNDFRNGNTNAEPPAEPDPNEKKDGNAKVPVLTDRVLQRAIHLYSALQAIKAR